MDRYALEFKWTVSKGRDTYGYNICTLYVDGRKVSSCNGGGYDMEGTALGNWVAREFADRLRALTPEQMPKNSHWERAKDRPVRDWICKDCGHIVTEEAANQVLDCPICEKTSMLPGDVYEGRLGMNDGEQVDDGRYLYGLTFHDPNFDPGKAIIGKDCTDRTFSKKSEGKTVEQAEADGDTVGLERYQAFYSASSKVPTKKHTVPLIDGACGFNSVEKILGTIGCELERIVTESKRNDLYILLCKS